MKPNVIYCMISTAYPLLPLTILQETQKLDFEGKRDRWIGYDTTAHDDILEEYAKVEKVKQVLKAETLNNNDQRVRQPTESKSDRLVSLLLSSTSLPHS